MATLTASRYRRGALAIKIETTYGVESSVAAAAADILEVANVTYRANQEQFVDERIAGTIYARPDIPGMRTVEMTGEILLRGTNSSSSGTTPEADRLLRAIGWEQTYSTSLGTWSYSNTQTTMGESVTASLFAENAPVGKSLGSFATGRVRMRVGEPAVLAFTIRGKYQAPSTADLITATPSTIIPPTFKGANLRVSTSSYAPRLANIEVDLGSVLEYVTDAGSTNGAGVAGAIIENRRALITLDPELVSTTVYDWHAKRDSPGTTSVGLGLGDSLTWGIGSTANQYNYINFTAPRFQVLDITPGQRSGTNSLNIAGKLNAATSATELTIQFGAS